ncbi:MAG: hypothetical protein AAGH15_13870 [Myxococcota bacterium]
MTTLIAVLAASGCKVTPEDISYWKRTVKGPGKIVAVILSDKYPIELRTQASLALVEMERSDVEGVDLMKRALDQLRASNAEDMQRIVAGMVPGLIEQMRGTSDATASGENAPPPPAQVRAKDAAYILVLIGASGEAKEQLINAVVGWYATDFAQRSLAGNYSAEQVVRSLGSEADRQVAARQLVEAMTPRIPQQAMIKISELLGQIGNDDTKKVAGETLVRVEREMEGQEYLDWLKGQIRSSYEEQGRTVSDAQVEAVAALNRENYINDGALPAMKFLAESEAVANRLLEIARTAPAASAPPFVKEATNLRRQRALMALEGAAKREHLEQLLALALDANNPINVRDYAFDRVGDIRSTDAIPRLWPLVAYGEGGENDDLQKRIRWRAGELVLVLGGADVVAEFFQRLPSDRGIEYEPEELEGYATRMAQMTPRPERIDTLVERQLASSNWFAKTIALRFIERTGEAGDVRKMERLQRDRTDVVGDGWERREIATVGKVAESAITGLRERLAHPEGQDGASMMEAAAMGGETG